MEQLEIFIARLKKININLDLVANYPWIYIDKINGKKVKETHQSEHGFVIGYHPIKPDQHFQFSTIEEIFWLLKHYKHRRDYFERKLEEELNKLPYTKHADDGGYNDGQLAGFEHGARWAFNNI